MEKQLTLSQAIDEIRTKWGLNDQTKIIDIHNYYYELTGLSIGSTGFMLNYLYEYIIESMYKDGDISEETAKTLYKYYGMEVNE